MSAEFEQHVMRPGDTFVADECGCSVTVESGPRQESSVRQAPTCCCGHPMHKEEPHGSGGAGKGSAPIDERSSAQNVPGQAPSTAGAPGAPVSR